VQNDAVSSELAPLAFLQRRLKYAKGHTKKIVRGKLKAYFEVRYSRVVKEFV